MEQAAEAPSAVTYQILAKDISKSRMSRARNLRHQDHCESKSKPARPINYPDTKMKSNLRTSKPMGVLVDMKRRTSTHVDVLVTFTEFSMSCTASELL